MRTVRDEDSDEGVAFENVRVKRASPKAMLCVINDEEHWIPRSQVHDDSEVFVDDTEAIQGSPGKLVITRWFARKNGLVDE